MQAFYKAIGSANPVWKYSTATLLGLGVLTSPVHAISITPASLSTGSDPNAEFATQLKELLQGSAFGINVTNVSVSLNRLDNAVSAGTFTNESNTYGVSNGFVISSGNVNDYNDGTNTDTEFTTGYGVPATTDQEALLDPITGGSFDHNDITQIDVTFDVDPDPKFDQVAFNVVFGSEEYPEYVDSDFIDAFGLYINGNNIATTGGLPVNINHPDMRPIPGTELDGILAPDPDGSGAIDPKPVVTYSGSVTPGSTGNKLTFIVSDTSDDILDTVAYISTLTSEGASEELPVTPTEQIDSQFIYTDVPSGLFVGTPLEGNENALEYLINPDSNALFTKILELPIGFGDQFDISAEGEELGTFLAGEAVDFLELLGNGVSSFTIFGINSGTQTIANQFQALAVTDPNLFAVKLEFDQPSASFAVQQAATQDIPEPTSILGLLTFGILGASSVCKRRQQQKA
ncbi:MAG TPA: choice-of-anchor L domain-containing protein [Oculatellaceae cyanobacterium]|jgi:hypothetical protein